jgi:hypothetical protein
VAVFPHQHDRPGAPGRVQLWEALRQPRNFLPLGVIVLLAVVGVGLVVGALARRATPPPNDFLARLVVSSSRPGTSLFGNDHYLGEIGPKAREFTVVPGEIHLRLVRSRCQASDTTLELKIGERLAVGPLDPVCGQP